jgi:hypothetical protein
VRVCLVPAPPSLRKASVPLQPARLLTRTTTERVDRSRADARFARAKQKSRWQQLAQARVVRSRRLAVGHRDACWHTEAIAGRCVTPPATCSLPGVEFDGGGGAAAFPGACCMSRRRWRELLARASPAALSRCSPATPVGRAGTAVALQRRARAGLRVHRRGRHAARLLALHGRGRREPRRRRLALGRVRRLSAAARRRRSRLRAARTPEAGPAGRRRAWTRGSPTASWARRPPCSRWG